MRSHLLPLLILTGCWKIDATVLAEETVPLNPAVGAPDGWVVEGFETELLCPDKEPARFYMVFPEEARRVSEDEPSPALPVAILFHSGSFDYVLQPEAANPIAQTSFQQSVGAEKRLTSAWSFTRIFATLGLYPNYDPVEVHAGTLPAALAEKGIAMMLPGNCWGDLWHNRSSLVDNNYEADFFFRNGRTMAEFSWKYLTEEFPPGNPLELPIEIDTERIYLVGLGEGSRAVTELLNITDTVDGETVFPYRSAAAAVVDSPIDDLTPFYVNDSEAFISIRSGLNRIFVGGEAVVGNGTLANIPNPAFPNRMALLFSEVDSRIPAGGLTAAIDRMNTMSSSRSNLWIHQSVEPQHVLSNADVVLSKAIADYLVEGVSGIDDPALIDGP